MREYRPRTVQELAACICDRCRRRLTPAEPGEWQERLSFDQDCGFDSVFGDGNTISLDLCQHCIKELLGQWLHVRPSADADGPATLARVLMTMPSVGEDADFTRHPGLEKFAEFGPDFMARGRGEHEQEPRGKAARRLGALKGRVRMKAGFDAPLSLVGKSKKKPKKKRP